MGQVFTHPGQEQMQAEIILASQSTVPGAKPIYTIRGRYPRPIHGEVMTHRKFGRNARSSRAVPVKTMLLECTTIPFVPWHWGKNQKGMQAGEDCNELVLVDWDHEIDHEERVSREEAWHEARDHACRIAQGYMDAGYHKQMPNRLLEPFAWIDVLITTTDIENFLWLRDHKDAEPHLQDWARLVKQAVSAAEIQWLEPGEWHLPYITADDIAHARMSFGATLCGSHGDAINEFLRKISAARCARISYKPFDGDASYEKELARYDMLVSSDRVHASPTEHQATPDTQFLGSLDVFNPGNETLTPDQTLDAKMMWSNPELHGNLDGYIQARKLIPNECWHEGIEA